MITTDNIITRRRKELGLTQVQLAEKTGMHKDAISKLERGDRPLSNLRLTTALSLADALQIDPHEFLKEEH